MRKVGRTDEKGNERFSRLLKKVLYFSLYLLSVSVVLFLGHRVYVHLSEDPIFRVREVEVAGCTVLTREALLSLARIDGVPNLFTVRLKDIAARLQDHPWIERVMIRKAFPDKIAIQIQERKPIAILQSDDLYYIDAKGVIFSRVGERDRYNYPFLTGLGMRAVEKENDDGNRLVTKALEFLRVVEREDTKAPMELSEVHMEKTSGVHCFTKAEGIEIKMGWDHFGEKLKRLAVVWTDLQRRGVSAVWIDSSDLNRTVVKRASGRGEARGK
jgi:cell division protein FtsQ